MADNKKVVISIVSYPFLPAKNGGQKNIALFYKYFSRHVSLTCISTQRNDISFADGYEVKKMLSDSSIRYANPFYFFTIRNIIKKNKAGFLLLEHPYYGWLGLLLKKICGVKLIIHSHNIEATRWKSLDKWWWKLLWHYEKYVHKHADFSYFITEEDLKYGISEYKLQQAKCAVITYGIENNIIPSSLEKAMARRNVCDRHELNTNSTILLLNGSFGYKPNLDALLNVLEKVNPFLNSKPGFSYTLLICGMDIPADIIAQTYPNVCIAGFVNDMNEYLLAADIFLNAVTDGGGIKTKLVEALGNNLSTVSTENGAIGVNPDLCNGKLAVVRDDDWDYFANEIIRMSGVKQDISDSFFDFFQWENIGRKAALHLKDSSKTPI